MNKPEINQEVYEQYTDATVALFMEHYSAMLTEKISSEDSTESAPFPEKLDVKCKALIKKEAAKQKRLTLWKHTKRTLKAAAAFAVAVMTLFSALFVSVEAFRVKVINFYIENKNGHWVITGNQELHDNSNPHLTNYDTANPLYGLIPKEYTLVNISNADAQRISASYKDADSNIIRFITFPYDASMQIDSEKAVTTKEIKILNFDGVITVKEQTTQVAWCNETTSIMYLIITNNLTEVDLIEIAERFASRIQQ